MYILLISIVIGLFVVMLFLNVYFRVKVMKAYKELVQARVDFTAKQIFSKQRIEDELVPLYPAQAEQIRTFSRYLIGSIRMGTVLLALITIFGGILMWYRE
ncbi:hypothetical protein CEQ90_17425 [Lewinellaceae bacterium SD302]|nr:hypothetical protein CEQ90_17425 [Lewinellaceae bacterium SD302]